MEIDIIAFLKQQPVLNMFIILGLGLLVGHIRIGGVELGGVTGVLFVGLTFGHFGFPVPTSSANIGFILFIYCVGAQAGPQFFTVFKEDGTKYAWLAVVAAISATVAAWGCTVIFQFDLGVAAGLLAGALTSTPTLVAAQDALNQGLKLPDGVQFNEVLDNISSAYAITYVFGMAGLVLFMSFFPKMLRIDVHAEAQAYAEKRASRSLQAAAGSAPAEQPTVRTYRVEKSEVQDKPIAVESLGSERSEFPGEVQRIRRGEEVFTPEKDDVFAIGDIIAVIGFQPAHAMMVKHVGPEVIDHDLVDRSMESRRIIVSSAEIEGKTLADLDFSANWQCWLTQIVRAGVALPRRPELRVQRGDVLVLTGAHSKLDALAKAVGHHEVSVYETDLVTLAFGVALGVFIGTFAIKLRATSISLGTAGGVLLVGLVFGLLHSQKPTFGRFPAAARYILMELGLLIFMQSIAVDAGETIVATFLQVGPKLALGGVAVTLIPVFACFFVGRAIFKMNAALLLGAITGALTSTAALRQVNNQAQSTLPMLGYVGTYTFANVLLALAGAIIVRF